MEHLQDGYILAGRYRIDRFLGRGGFSCTYVATDMSADGGGDRKVAIKELLIRDFSTRDADGVSVITVNSSRQSVVDRVMTKFIEEARFLQSISSPDIVHVSDSFSANNTAYYVMDYVDGESLADKVKRGPLSESDAVAYITQVANALKQVHGLNRLHLDVKPANIMVDHDGHAILIDFGTSKQYDADSGENHSTLLGKTLNYAAIEQWGNNVKHFHVATDIYALGATLYKLLTGVTPPGATDRISGTALPPLPATISAATAKAVNKAMEISREARPQSIDEFLALLNGVETPPADSCDEDLEVTVISAGNDDDIDAEATVVGTAPQKGDGSGNGALLDLSNVAKTTKAVGKGESLSSLMQGGVSRWIVVGVIAALVAVAVTFAVLYFTDSKPKTTSSPSTTTATTSTSVSGSSGDAGASTQVDDTDQKNLQEFVKEFNASYSGRVIASGLICRDIELNGNTIVLNLVLDNGIMLTDKDFAEFKSELVPQLARGFMRGASRNSEVESLLKRNKLKCRVNLYQNDRLLVYGIAPLTDS
ncbi:MAG: serine/threonine protein kinase [Muribaculaceae bacterium]|nr:serine/threonine protein kinase [Muribaculaceae bacterium]MDE6321271.1 serine/threonine protein kinase [Muribaculaceae bacterium]